MAEKESSSYNYTIIALIIFILVLTILVIFITGYKNMDNNSIFSTFTSIKSVGDMPPLEF
jgi:hypothetical protein